MATRTEVGVPLSIPSERDAALGERASQALEALIEGTQPVSARFGDTTVDLPTPALRLLREILDWIAQGKGGHPDTAARRTHHAAGGRASAGVADAPGPASRRRGNPLPEGRLAPPHPRRGHSRLAPRDRAPPPRGARRADRTRPETRPAVGDGRSESVAGRHGVRRCASSRHLGTLHWHRGHSANISSGRFDAAGCNFGMAYLRLSIDKQLAICRVRWKEVLVSRSGVSTRF